MPSKSAHRVDREAGIIYGVKVVGKSSGNSHGVRGVEGTDYSEGALKSALPLYEGLKVNVDHPSREKPGADRSAYDRIGKLCNCRIQEGEIYADLHLLKTHSLTERLLEAAEKMPDLFGLSHNGYGKGHVEGTRYVITEIPEVRSVDIVADAGTVRSLFESQEKTTMKKKQKTLKSVLESMKIPAPMLTRLFEMEGMMPDMAADAMPAPAEGAEETYETHLGRMIVAILNDETLSPEDKKKKVLQAVKLVAGDESPPPDSEKIGATTEEGDEEASDEEEGDEKKETKESLKAEVAKLRREKTLRELCEAQEFKPTPTQFKALQALSDADAKAFIKESKENAGSGKKTAPRSSPSSRTLQESAEGKGMDRKEFVNEITD